MDTLNELESWEINMLKDFVRGKGHGSVARLPLELLAQEDPDLEEAPQMLNLVDPNVMPQGGFYSNKSPQKPAPGTSIVMPSSIIAPASYLKSLHGKYPNANFSSSVSESRSNNNPGQISPEVSLQAHNPGPSQSTESVVVTHEKLSVKKPEPRRKSKALTTSKELKKKSDHEVPSKEAFKELADLFQSFIDRRKAILKSEEPARRAPMPITAAPDTGTSAIGKWEPMDPEEEYEDIDPEVDKPDPNDWTAKMKDLSEQLSTILKQIKSTKEKRPVRPQVKPKPKMTIIRNGSAEQTPDGRYEFVATITLVQDQGKNILVDTGLGTDINGRTKLLDELQSLNLAPPNIHIVVTTHGDPDHAGGIHDFPDALHFQGWYMHQATLFNLSDLFETDRHRLTDNVYLLKTPGHSSDDISVVIENEATYGNVIICGDTFLRREDVDYPAMWKPLSVNEQQQAESRRKLICGDHQWIVPGHGKPFVVDYLLKQMFACPPPSNIRLS